jgi:hypothetical protein
MKLAHDFTHKMNGNKSITAMNIAPVNEMHAYDIMNMKMSSLRM